MTSPGNDIKIKVDAKADLAKREIAATGARLRSLGDEAREAAARSEILDRELRQVTREAAGLDRQLGQTRAEVKRLSAEFAAGNRDPRFLDDLKKQRAAVADLTRARREMVGSIERDAERARTTVQRVNVKIERENHRLFGLMTGAAAKAGAEAGGTFASAFQGGIMEAFKALPTEAKAAVGSGIAAAVALAMPIVTSAVTTAVLLGVGGGGLAGGIALAAKDPAVRSAFSDLGEEVKADLTEAAAPFRDELIGTADIAKDAWKDIGPGIKDIFAELAPTVRPLAQGLADMARNSLPGIKEAARAAVPLLLELAHQLPAMGKAISSFFSSIAKGGPGAIAFLRGFMGFVEGNLKLIGAWVEHMSRALGGASVLLEAMGLIESRGPQAIGGTIGAVKDVGDEARDSANKVDELKVSFNELFGTMMSIDEANIALKRGWRELNEELRDGKRTLDQNTEAGLDNSEAVLRYIKLARDAYDATMRQTGSTTEATRKYNEQIAALRSLLLSLGYNVAQVDAFIAKYKEMAALPDINLSVTTWYSARGAAGGTAFDPGSREDRRYGGAPKRAAGGPSWGWTQMHEYGREVAKLPTGTMVYPAGQSNAMIERNEQTMAMAGRRGATDVIEMVVAPGADSRTAAFLHGLERDGILQFRRKGS